MSGLLGDHGLMLVLAFSAAVIATRYFSLSLSQILFALAATPVLVGAVARTAGRTDVAPHSSVAQLAQLGASFVPPQGPGSTVVAGAVVAGPSLQTATALWSWRAGRLLGSSPRAQLIAQLVGVVLGAVVSVPIYRVIVDVDRLGTAALPAPSATQAKALAELLSSGTASMPAFASSAVVVAFGLGLFLEPLSRRRGFGALSPSAIGAGLLLPAHFTASIVLGALVKFAVVRRFGVARGDHWLQPMGSGAIIGESLIGVVLALFALS